MSQEICYQSGARSLMTSITGGGLRHVIFLPVYLLAASAFFLIIMSVVGSDTWENEWVPVALAALLSGYLAWEVRREVLVYGTTALLSPAVLASIVHFYMSYCTPMMGLPFDDNIIQLTIFWTKDWQIMGWISYAMMLVCVSAFAFWRGYRCFLGGAIGDTLKRGAQGTGLIRPYWNVNLPVVFLMIAVSVSARIIQISTGIFGYTANAEALTELAAYRSYLDYAAGLGTLSLFLIAMQTFSPQKGQKFMPLLLTCLLLEIGFGFMAAFKGQVIVPVIIVGAAYFMTRGRFPIRWAIAGIVMIYAAFAIVEPYRNQASNPNNRSDQVSVGSILGGLQDAYTTASNDDSGKRENAAVQFFRRSELVSVTSTGVRYRDTVQDLGPDAPDFVGAVVFAPIHAVVPRLIWADKPIYEFGQWFDYRVTGRYKYGVSSTGMGPVSYLYFMGGIPVVVLGFFGFGILYRALFVGLTSLGAGGWLVYFALLPILAAIYSEIGPTLAGLIQMIPLAILLQAVVLKKPTYAGLRSNQSPAAAHSHTLSA
jgi:hypothetical protein